MDLKQFDGPSDEGAKLAVLHPGTGEPTDISITLAGTDSKRWRRAQREAGRRAMSDARSKNDVLEVTKSNMVFCLASVTLAWWNVELDGESLECTRENAERLYSQFPWLYEQVDRFVGDRSRFFRREDGAAPLGGACADEAATPAEGR